MAVRKQ